MLIPSTGDQRSCSLSVTARPARIVPVPMTIRDRALTYVGPARSCEGEDTLTSVGQMPWTDREVTGAYASPVQEK